MAPSYVTLSGRLLSKPESGSKLLNLEHDSTVRRFRLIASCSGPGAHMKTKTAGAIAGLAMALSTTAGAVPPPQEDPAFAGFSDQQAAMASGKASAESLTRAY